MLEEYFVEDCWLDHVLDKHLDRDLSPIVVP